MISSIDGRATVDGRAGGLGNPADRALLRELRSASDALLVGRNTLTTERYATVLDADQCAQRVADGRSAQPIVATVSRQPGLLAHVPLLGEPDVEVVVYSDASPGEPLDGAEIRVLDPLTPRGAVADLHERRGAELIVCEGGPRLLHDLVADGVVDDLVLTVAPLLVAGGAPAILTGQAFDEPLGLRLVHSARAGDYLVLHYAR
jgi:riboflavin biosynthesis pyrimidine reductase